MNKRRKHDEEHIDETWLIPYADLLTLLLALFIVLFASSQVDVAKFSQLKISLNEAFNQSGHGVMEFSSVTPNDLSKAGKTKKQNEKDENTQAAYQQEVIEMEQLKQKLDQYIKKHGLSTTLETKLTNDRLMITIRDHALFASGSAIVKEKAKELAIAISNMLVQYPEYKIIVAGHTDNRPIHTFQFESNWDLSAARALNFMKILLLNEEINPGRFSVVGYGEHEPIATNETAEGRQKNRRVEISIIRNFTQPNEKQKEIERLQNE